MKQTISLKIDSFVPGDKNQPILNLDTGISESLNKNSKKFLKELKKFNLRELVGFRNDALEEKLKNEIRNFLGIGKRVGNQNIVFGFGSYSILERLAWKFLKKGLMVGEFPQFRFFPMEYLLAGGEYQGFWRTDFSFPREEILKAVDKRRDLRAVYINNPNNPTGRVFARREIVEIVKKAERKNVFVIVDEVYGDLLPELTLAGLVKRFTNLLVLRSFSKIFGLQNLRLGYLIAGKEIIGQYQNICNWKEINNFGAILGLMILRDKDYLETLKNECPEFKKETIEALTRAGFEIAPTDPHVPLVFIRAGKGIDIAKYFRQRNIKVDYARENYQVLEKSFPDNYARIRIPAARRDLEILRKRLCSLLIKKI